MEEITKQTETQDIKPENNTARRIVGVIFGVLEILLLLRFIFKLLGANPENGFVNALYVGTQFLVAAFEGIFPQATTAGVAAKAVFEPATLIAMAVIAVIALVVLAIMKPRKGTHTYVEDIKKTGFPPLDDHNEEDI